MPTSADGTDSDFSSRRAAGIASPHSAFGGFVSIHRENRREAGCAYMRICVCEFRAASSRGESAQCVANGMWMQVPLGLHETANIRIRGQNYPVDR